MIRERIEDLFMFMYTLIVIAILGSISWAMWRPILIDQNNLQAIVNNITMQQQQIGRLSQDVDILKRTVTTSMPENKLPIPFPDSPKLKK